MSRDYRRGTTSARQRNDQAHPMTDYELYGAESGTRGLVLEAVAFFLTLVGVVIDLPILAP
jgi:hypothetical protein